MVGTFSGKKSLKALSNKVFRFIQQTLLTRTGKRQEAKGGINNQFLITGFSVNRLFSYLVQMLKLSLLSSHFPLSYTFSCPLPFAFVSLFFFVATRKSSTLNIF
ncbi:MAG: hypothetical protein EWV63_15755 [Microcystis aeruginosa Ma_OC_H_19870700_S124]|uniref:Uncharacterized protein n=1 Tax=Microcystis aeruginosa Ma_OC_H_19870700_S124 TaxID=2486262 RepID=A0A552AFI9_MICAE|nr:MAG: hypothetical protein EWV63_15755 [Microcystis aeruginosa Ma_OC_H_19870700_S124]